MPSNFNNNASSNTLVKTSTKPLRLLLASSSKSLWDLAPVIRHLTVGLLDEPIQFFFTCPSDADSANIPSPPVQIIRYPKSILPIFRNKATDTIVEQIEGIGISLIHALDTDSLDITQAVSARLDLDYIVSVYSLHPNIKHCDIRCRAITAGSEPIYQNLLKIHSLPDDIIHLIRPGVHQASEPTCFVKPQQTVAIVAGGSLDDYKHFAAVLEAFYRLRETHHDCIFFIVGEGSAERHLRKLTNELKLTEDLTFIGYKSADELNGILRAADIYISPVPTDRVDINLLSAMAAGVPVVAAGARACDFIIDGHTALTFQPANSAEITEKLSSLLDDHDFARRLVQNALAHLKENHSPSKMTAEMLQLYYSITTSKRPAE